jgi:hypothetical protein
MAILRDRLGDKVQDWKKIPRSRVLEIHVYIINFYVGGNQVGEEALSLFPSFSLSPSLSLCLCDDAEEMLPREMAAFNVNM